MSEEMTKISKQQTVILDLMGETKDLKKQNEERV